MEGINATLNDTLGGRNESERIPATPQSLAIAYGSLILMAILPVFYGSFKSLKFQTEQKKSGAPSEAISCKYALVFPLFASVILLTLYFLLKMFSKERISNLLTIYFVFLGVLAFAHVLNPLISKLIPWCPNKQYHLVLTKGDKDTNPELCHCEFDSRDLICLCCSLFVGFWYLSQKHWIANNIVGIAFSVYGIEVLQLNRITYGCILLSGLFIYDVVWVFATDVMVTVAVSFDVPIKLVFPHDLIEKGLEAKNFSMLGLGDIIIPGIYIALLLRFDKSLNNNKKTYFYSGFVAYILALVLTIFIVHYFRRAQPALLYIVPAIIGASFLVALIKGELKLLLRYEDSPGKVEAAATTTTTATAEAKEPTEEK